MGAPLLEVEDLHAYYGKSHILHGVTFHVDHGEIVSLLGRNGVGRSTTIKTIMGNVSPIGSIRFKGEEIDGLKPHQIGAQGPGLRTRDARHLSGADGSRRICARHEVRARSAAAGRCDDMFCMFPMLRERADAPGGVLSGGEQQMLTICRTLMGDPDLIMVDEPTEGLSPKLVERVGQFLEESLRAASRSCWSSRSSRLHWRSQRFT